MYYPREETWDVLIKKTGAMGLHWQDHEEMQGYWLPEWSHMSGSEAEMLIVGSHGFGAIYDLLIGSISRGILKDTEIPVLVVPIRDPSLRP